MERGPDLPFLSPTHCVYCKYSIVDNQRRKKENKRFKRSSKYWTDVFTVVCMVNNVSREREREIPAHRENENEKKAMMKEFFFVFLFHSSNADGLRMHCH